MISADDNTTIVVKNYAGASLPATGGPGPGLAYFLGTLLTVLGGAGLVMRNERGNIWNGK